MLNRISIIDKMYIITRFQDCLIQKFVRWKKKKIPCNTQDDQFILAVNLQKSNQSRHILYVTAKQFCSRQSWKKNDLSSFIYSLLDMLNTLWFSFHLSSYEFYRINSQLYSGAIQSETKQNKTEIPDKSESLNISYIFSFTLLP